MSEYETVIGLECHAQLLTMTKLFCGCRASFGAPANTNICPVCIGLPGALPVLNRRAVELATRAALAVGCRVNETSVFARKNYFYPDLPKGYQISQYDRPLAEGGAIALELDGQDDRKTKTIRIERIHMEEDAGKLLHEGFEDSASKSGVDFNRSGVPLIEIVSEPDMSSPEEATRYAESLKEIIEYTEASDADMEKGNFRFDGNVSVRPLGTSKLGTKVEIKNLNSFRFLALALAFEVDRQAELIESGGRVVQETRLYDPDAGKTVPMRSKEEAHDYRYFPEPDLPPVTLDHVWIKKARESLPELPEARRQRLVSAYGLPRYDAAVLTSSRELADYFETAAESSGNPKAVSNWVMSEVLRKVREVPQVKDTGAALASLPVPPRALGELIKLIDDGAISGTVGKDVFEKMFASGDAPGVIIEREGLTQISDTAAIEDLVRGVIDENPGQVAEFRAGKDKVLGWMVGQIMKASRGQANPKLARETLVRLLKES
ncbi:MAG: Asp-tRNA(Asn)/Glu-tRNA(Gln) amidotransferase subunit GatB [Acidobacteriota bacterium]|nr:MAG: Asp-tRNA(Asn)/Glu-tRNA(Gln) amidotransferase subunit GatB [Acidobacteriota bacterium]